VKLSTHNLILDADTSIDLQLHTTYSDGTVTAEQLVDYARTEQFGLIAITDHDRVDTAVTLQELAAEKQFPILVAAEFSTNWRGQQVDTLCFGFDPDNETLKALTQKVLRLQRENTQQVYDYLIGKGHRFDSEPDGLQTILDLPAAPQPHGMTALLSRVTPDLDVVSARTICEAGGLKFVTNPVADVVDAIHQSGGICLIAHPGRGQYYPIFDPPLLDAIRGDAPIDGFEAYYPLHSAEQTAMFVDYARQHDLLTSSGSDSHGANRKPIKYPAQNSRKLLERLGVQVRQ
jgi:predicted metal-dependent phosphoesterase TrpH